MNGFRLALTVLLLLLGVPSASADDASPAQMALSPASAATEAASLSYRAKPDNPEFRYIEGELTLSGVLLAYWETLYLDAGPVTLAEADTQQTLQLRFYPADQGPAIRALADAVPAESVERIFLYRSRSEAPQMDHIEAGYAADETAAIEQALEVFADVPAEFMEFREGYVMQPVSITLADMVSFTEGDHPFVYARAKAVEPLAGIEVDVAEIEDFQADAFLGQPWRQEFVAADDVVLRASPAPDAAAVGNLTAGTFGIEKIQTLPDGWVKVRVAPEGGPMLEGYLNASELQIIN